MKKALIVLASLSLILMHGCSFEEEQEIVPTTHIESKTLDIGNLVEDPNFKEYVYNINALSQKYDFNNGQVNETISKYYNEQIGLGNSFSQHDKEMYAKSLGFESLSHIQEIEKVTLKFVSMLDENYNLEEISSSEIENAILSSIVTHSASFNETAMRGSNCSDRYSNCQLGAYGMYAVTGAGCVGLGAGVAALSFWCAGCAGVALGSACVAGAAAVLVSDLNECGYDYVDCVS